jgi:DNA-binding NtrC family response regulator
MTEQAILCVDDEAIIVLAIKQELKTHFRERFIYETALNAEEALTIIDELTADGVSLILVISDWLMPGMKGDEFLSSVKRSHPTVKTILVTGHSSPEILERMKRDKVTNSVVLKPWKNVELMSTVENLLADLESESSRH